jgi:hypothetical protein
MAAGEGEREPEKPTEETPASKPERTHKRAEAKPATAVTADDDEPGAGTAEETTEERITTPPTKLYYYYSMNPRKCQEEKPTKTQAQ